MLHKREDDTSLDKEGKGKTMCGGRKVKIFNAWVFFSIFFFGSRLPASAGPAEIRAFVSIPPQKSFVKSIGGDKVQVETLVPPGADPHTYEPKPAQMRALARSDLYFAVGIEIEKVWLPKLVALNPKLIVVPTHQGIQRITAPFGHGHEERGNKGKAGAGPDPHIWLSPPLVKLQADHILSALIRRDPAHEAAYRANHKEFLSEVEALDQELKGMFSGREGGAFLVLHPSWGYFAQAYGLRQISIEVEGKEPGASQMKEIIKEARRRGIRVVLAQPQFSKKKAEVIAREIGGRVVSADPLAEEWAANLRRAARAIQEALDKR